MAVTDSLATAVEPKKMEKPTEKDAIDMDARYRGIVEAIEVADQEVRVAEAAVGPFERVFQIEAAAAGASGDNKVRDKAAKALSDARDDLESKKEYVRQLHAESMRIQDEIPHKAFKSHGGPVTKGDPNPTDARAQHGLD